MLASIAGIVVSTITPTLASNVLTCVYTVPMLACVEILPRYRTPTLASSAGIVVSTITPTFASKVLT